MGGEELCGALPGKKKEFVVLESQPNNKKAQFRHEVG